METVDDMRKCTVDGQKKADIPELGLNNDYNYKIRKPSAQVSKVVYPGIQSFVTFTHTMSLKVLVTNVVPNDGLVGKESSYKTYDQNCTQERKRHSKNKVNQKYTQRHTRARQNECAREKKDQVAQTTCTKSG